MEEPQEKTLLTTSISADGSIAKEVKYSDLSISQLVDLAARGSIAAIEELTNRLGGVNPFEEGK